MPKMNPVLTLGEERLQAALERGHEATVKLLLDKSADGDAQGGHYGNALQAVLQLVRGLYVATTQRMMADPFLP
ncbi:hypothetical protein DM02DRAFT_664026 [Periconia macrospinosa]|uniref:Ankyrin n=1 Tax=Periconia macrospinosa TaxID=97972 RepID=A0A2V1D1Q0_9PLEO|nr:hypothetical protein DM02DRAFT_664026 [Periconia macrospinosa]